MGSGSGNISDIVVLGGITSSAPGFNIPLSANLNERNYLTLTSTGVGTINYNAFFVLGAASGTPGSIYQVPNGKTFQGVGLEIMDLGTDSKMQLGTATASFTTGTGSAPTGAVYWAGGVTTAFWNFFAGHTAGLQLYMPMTYQISQNLFPFSLNMDGASKYQMKMFGYEF